MPATAPLLTVGAAGASDGTINIARVHWDSDLRWDVAGKGRLMQAEPATTETKDFFSCFFLLDMVLSSGVVGFVRIVRLWGRTLWDPRGTEECHRSRRDTRQG
jgi:hypothetical protein